MPGKFAAWYPARCCHPMVFRLIMPLCILKAQTFMEPPMKKGIYHIKAPAGRYTIVFSSVGFEPKELTVLINEGERTKLNVKLRQTAELAEVVIVGNTFK